MQIFHVGELVRARRDRWRVVDTKAFDGCQLVTMAGATATNHGVERRLLAPFDAIDRIPLSHVPRFVGAVRWRRALRGRLQQGLPGELRAISSANIDLLPHQLQPALAVVRGFGCRLLLADDVGLGKTIEAGAIVAELRSRGAADRVLILTPPGLREQWAQELLDRFDIRADIVDFRGVRERVATLRPGVNPWTTWPVAIASVDYVKQPDVLRAVAAQPWDVVIIDEAHRVANAGDRHGAVASVASHAGYVILLTATPHSGDTKAFESLCGIGGHGDRLLVFRRTRHELSSAVERRAHRLLVRSSAAERRMHARLTDFERAVRTERGDVDRDAWIALAVLRKRAFSSAQALNLSIARRLETLAPAPLAPAQLPLPLDVHGELDGADDAPPWQPVLALQDADQERRLLTSISAAAAAAAAGRETKVAAIGRLIRRIAEPVIVFTEYRDTLAHVARLIQEPVAVLHGGLPRHERTAVLRAFTEGRRRILLATDAAGEGLNLHQTCRIVINLELPWNPMRLEQRIGRVDRIGQRRTVHAFHLVAAGTGEEQLLADLRKRIAHAKTEIGAPDPFGNDSAMPTEQVLPSGLADVSAEVARLRVLRALAAPAALPHRPTFESDRPLITFARHRSTRQRLGRRILLIWEVDVEDGVGRLAATQVVATASVLTSSPSSRSALKATVARLTATALVQDVESAADEWRRHAAEAARRYVGARLARERAIQSSVDSRSRTGIQPGLFDGRAAHAQAADQAALAEMSEAIAQRIALLESIAGIDTRSRPRLRLVLFPSR
jgi:superfamily II DNA or RNA helicase